MSNTVTMSSKKNTNRNQKKRQQVKSSDEDSYADTAIISDTIPDEEYYKNSRQTVKAHKSLPDNLKKDLNKELQDSTNTRKELQGPNINIKLPKRRYNSNDEKNYFFNKIKTKQKTELCKNWMLYNDCYYKDTCSFAHGEAELRHNQPTTKYKTKVCQMFHENHFCSYGNRCIYLHIIKDQRLFSYSNILKKFGEENLVIINQTENEKKEELWKIINSNRSRKQFKIPRLKVFESIVDNIKFP